MTIESFLSKLEKVRSRGSGKWMACCPNCGDRNPSLAIKDDNGTILIRCFASQCGVDAICASIDFNVSDLFPPNDNYDHSPEAYERRAKSGRAYFPPGQVLEALAFETMVTYMIAKDMQTSGIDGPTRDRLLTATSRINAALEYIRR